MHHKHVERETPRQGVSLLTISSVAAAAHRRCGQSGYPRQDATRWTESVAVGRPTRSGRRLTSTSDQHQGGSRGGGGEERQAERGGHGHPVHRDGDDEQEQRETVQTRHHTAQ